MVQQIRKTYGTRSLPLAGSTREQGGGDGCCLRAGHPISTPGYLEADVIGFDALWASMLKCRRGVMWKGSVASFCLNGIESVSKLSSELMLGTYKPRKTSTFMVTSPKLRTITSTPFRDRVYQRSLNDNVLYPVVVRSLIYDNAACQTGKGTDFARNRLKCHMQRHYRKHGTCGWVLHIDIRAYYASLSHSLGESVFDKAPEWARKRAVSVLRSQYAGNRGYNPGSQMVQIVGIAALNSVDHFIKERLRVKGYVRYMDDMILIHESRTFLEECLGRISTELEKLGLEIHPGKTKFRQLADKTPFLGFDFRLSESGKVVMTLRPESVKSMRRRISRLTALEARGLRPPGTAPEAYKGWRAHAAKGDSRLLLERCDRWFAGLEGKRHDRGIED